MTEEDKIKAANEIERDEQLNKALQIAGISGLGVGGTGLISGLAVDKYFKNNPRTEKIVDGVKKTLNENELKTLNANRAKIVKGLYSGGAVLTGLGGITLGVRAYKKYKDKKKHD